jgi:hypothetical protein
MASVDLSELIGDLEGAVTVPGIASPYAASSDTEWLTRLRNAFWTAFNEGVFSGFTCNEDGIVSPSSSGSSTTFGRELQQIVILYAAINIVQNQMLQLKNQFRAKAGSVEYETQQSAQMIKAILDSLLIQRNTLLQRLSDLGWRNTYYYDSVTSRDSSLKDGTIQWTGSSSSPPGWAGW